MVEAQFHCDGITSSRKLHSYSYSSVHEVLQGNV